MFECLITVTDDCHCDADLVDLSKINIKLKLSLLKFKYDLMWKINNLYDSISRFNLIRSSSLNSISANKATLNVGFYCIPKLK